MKKAVKVALKGKIKEIPRAEAKKVVGGAVAWSSYSLDGSNLNLNLSAWALKW